ncbi:MAG: hypothetical protein LBL06_05220 [Treponema sp.]|jgi:hypothetical protein|nr:hypothetical protein [Treponema sp.]
MKTILKIWFLALTITFSGTLIAQETTQPNNDLLHYYNMELFQWDYSIFSGLTLNFQNQSSLSMYGIKDSMKNALMQYEDVNQQYRSYRSKTIAGNILMWGGFTVAIAGAYVPLFGDWQDKNAHENTLKAGLGIMLGGLVTELIGACVLYAGQENIFNAVNLYNRHKINDYRNN